MFDERLHDDINSRKIHLHDSSSSSRPALLLQEALHTCSKSSETGDFCQSSKAISALVDLLDSILEFPASDSDNALLKGEASEEALSELHRFLSSPSSNQMVVEALSLELPKVVVKFAGVSEKCREITEGIIDCLISACSSRDMLSIICEALDSLIRVSQVPIYFVLLFKGISKVFLCIMRRHVEQVKVALPIILNVLHAVSLESDEEDKDSLCDLFSAAISIAMSMQAVCEKLEGKRKEDLRAILGLYVLQNMALLSRSNLAYEDLNCVSFVLELSRFLPFCGLSYLGLITGCDVDLIADAARGEDGNDFITCFSFFRNGASLAVIWGYISGEVAKAAEEQLVTVLDNLQSSRTKRWQAVGMLRYIFTSTDYSWQIKAYSVDFLSSIMSVSISEESNGDLTDESSYMPSLFSALQAVVRVIICAPDAKLRKNAFAALKRVVSDLPCSIKFDILKALITSNDSPSMIAILIDLVKEEVFMENRQRISSKRDALVENRIHPSSTFWKVSALELVELVLKPPNGGPPSLPEHSEPVLSALNLYRFILMIESAGQTNCTDVLSKNALQKTYTDWLLPLRTLISGIEAENKNDSSEFALNTLCALNPVQVVLYHCIELAEGNLKFSK